MPWSAKAATLSRGRTQYLEAGDPRAPNVLLLLHAFPVGMRLWDPVAVPEGWRALAPALPGFDGSDPPPADSSSMDDYASHVLEFLAQQRVDTAVLGGLSMGGYVAFAAWRADPLRWRGVILADTRAGADSQAARAGREKMLQTLASDGTHGVADEMLPKLLGETTRMQRPHVTEQVRRLIERQTNEGVRAALVRLRDRPDSTPVLGQISVPTLVVVGDEDQVTPLSEAEQLQASLVDSRLVRIPHAGHLSCLENPAAFNAALTPFLLTVSL